MFALKWHIGGKISQNLLLANRESSLIECSLIEIQLYAAQNNSTLSIPQYTFSNLLSPGLLSTQQLRQTSKRYSDSFLQRYASNTADDELNSVAGVAPSTHGRCSKLKEVPSIHVRFIHGCIVYL